MTDFNIDAIKLDKGNHSSAKQGMCIMEAVAVYRGLPFTDAPPCVDSVLRSIAIRINDTVDDETRQRLKPYIFKLVGTAGQSRATHERMAFLAADRAIHVFAPMTLRARRREADALALEALPGVVDKATAEQARSAARQIAAAAAAYAAYAAADAAYGAADAAAAAADAADAAYAAAYAAGGVGVGIKARINDERFRLLDDLIALCEVAVPA